jgi:putative FmdB family regulatory protein
MRHYEYKCVSCGRTEEKFRPTAERDAPVQCSQCGGKAERVLSAFLATGPTPMFSAPQGNPAPPPPPKTVKPPIPTKNRRRPR